MDLNRLNAILDETTREFRKGEIEETRREGSIKVIDVYMMPHISDIDSKLEKVDLIFVWIGVDKEAAEKRKADLIEILETYPEPKRLAGGPSYIEMGAVLGSQDAALRLFALGKVLGLWNVVSPATLGMDGDQARQLAGQGFIMMSGFQPRV